jgi:hypothetical protein
LKQVSSGFGKFVMRISSLLLICVSGLALSACAATDSAYQLDSGLGVCGFSCKPKPIVVPVVTTPTTPVTPVDTTNTGNDADIKADTGDHTIALEAQRIVLPHDKVRSILTITEADPLIGTPKTVKIDVDTKTASKSSWPKSKTMKIDLYGTNTPFSYRVAGHVNTPPYAAPITPMAALVTIPGQGLGGTYEEYHIVQAGELGKNVVDEELQIWSWADSHAVQYRDVTVGGGVARNQAWSFGGTKSTAAVVDAKSGIVNFKGRFGATAKTSGYEDQNFGVNLSDTDLTNNDVQYLSHNRNWAVEGSTDFNVNFTTDEMLGTLSPEVWIADATMNGANFKLAVMSDNVNSQNHSNFMNTNILLKGKLTTNSTSVATDNSALAHNTIIGTAEADPNMGWVNYDGLNPVYAATFGANADSITGAFNVEAVGRDPWGGLALENDERGFLQIGGVFHAKQCTVLPCP